MSPEIAELAYFTGLITAAERRRFLGQSPKPWTPPKLPPPKPRDKEVITLRGKVRIVKWRTSI